MGKTKITSYQDLLSKLIDVSYGSVAKFLQSDEWEQKIKARYDENKETNKVRVTYFNDEENFRKTSHDLEMVEGIMHLDDLMEHEDDPAKLAHLMGVKKVVKPMLDDTLRLSLIGKVEGNYDEVKAKYDIAPEVNTQYNADRRKVGKMMAGNTSVPFLERTFPDMPGEEKMLFLNHLVRMNFSKKDQNDEMGQEYKASGTEANYIEIINDEATRILEDAIYGNPGINEQNDPAFRLGSLLSGKSEKEIDTVRDNLTNLRTLDGIRKMDIVPHPKAVNLKLENNAIAKVSAEGFLQHYKDNKLSYRETEWAESTVENMMTQLYNDDELNAFKKKKLDPIMGISIDGKPAYETYPELKDPNTTMFDRAKIKSSIIAAALEGKTLSAQRVELNKDGAPKFGGIIPIQTEVAMNKGRRGFMTWLKQVFNYEPKMDERILRANTNAVDLKVKDTEERSKAAAAKKDDQLAKNIDLFTDALDKDKMGKMFQLTNVDYDPKGRNPQTFSLIKTTNRPVSMTNIIRLYGMTKGYSYEELSGTDPKFDDIKKNLGKEFAEKYSAVSFDEFKESDEIKGLHPEAQKQKYRDYSVEKITQTNDLVKDIHDVLMKTPVTRVNMNDMDKVLNFYDKNSGFSSMLMDYSQGFEGFIHLPKFDYRGKIDTNKIVFENAKSLDDVTSMVSHFNDMDSFVESLTGKIKGAETSEQITQYAAMNKSVINANQDVYSKCKTWGEVADKMMNPETRERFVEATAFSNSVKAFRIPEKSTKADFDCLYADGKPIAKCVDGKISYREPFNNDINSQFEGAKMFFNDEMGRVYAQSQQYKDKSKENESLGLEQLFGENTKERENISLDELVGEKKSTTKTTPVKSSEEKTMKTPSIGK